MELARELSELQKRAIQFRSSLLTEEASKTSLVLPFLKSLGYDIFDPHEVIPEYTADVGTKKGEKVDYAICSNGTVNILIECKPSNIELNINHASQLYRYFSVTKAKLCILTNGMSYQFYSDMDNQNVMDKEPFFVLDITQLKPTDVRIVERFSKTNFDIDGIMYEAKNLKTGTMIRRYLEAEFAKPSEDLVSLVAKKVHDGRITQSVRETYERLILASMQSMIRDQVNDRLSSAIQSTSEDPVEKVVAEIADLNEEAVVTTEEELLGYRMVQAICAKIVEPSRVVLRDSKSYAAILLDDNNRKTIARLRFNSKSVKYISLFSGKDESSIKIETLEDIYKYEDQIRGRVLEITQSIK